MQLYRRRDEDSDEEDTFLRPVLAVDGEPTDMIVVAGEPEAVFDDSALEALASAEFRPYSEDGDRFARRVLMRFRFNSTD